jgi:hypothetical protein
MPALRRAFLLTAIFIAQPASAGGSVALSELLQNSDSRQISPEFIETVRSALARANLSATEVFCTAERLGRQWESLGGQRIGPYLCNLRGRTLEITSSPIYYDRDGNTLELGERALMRRATALKEYNLTVHWRD